MKEILRMLQLGWISCGVLFLSASCSEEINHGDKTPIVSVGKEYLFVEDVAPLLTSGMSSSDSAAFVKDYAEHWAQEMQLYQMAQRNVPDSKEIERLIKSYKISYSFFLFLEYD